MKKATVVDYTAVLQDLDGLIGLLQVPKTVAESMISRRNAMVLL